MNRWSIGFMILGTLMLLALSGCSKKESSQGQASLGTATGSVAGIKWSVPKRWTEQGPRPMRAATYGIPASEGDAEGGECGVFYFGGGQGGNVDMNIDRWIGQFEVTGTPGRSSKDVKGLKVTLVEIAGAYLAPSGPMMESQGKKDNYRLLGAIVEGPQGSVFFKLTGPAKTITASESEFNAMVESLEKQ